MSNVSETSSIIVLIFNLGNNLQFYSLSYNYYVYYQGIFQSNDLPKPGVQVITRPVKWVQQEERRNQLVEKAYEDYEKKYGVDRRKSRLIISKWFFEYISLIIYCQFWNTECE